MTEDSVSYADLLVMLQPIVSLKFPNEVSKSISDIRGKNMTQVNLEYETDYSFICHTNRMFPRSLFKHQNMRFVICHLFFHYCHWFLGLRSNGASTFLFLPCWVGIKHHLLFLQQIIFTLQTQRLGKSKTLQVNYKCTLL